MASPDKLGRRIAALMAGDGVKPIRAYHSSPYDFDRFDSRYIGRGEGHQAVGHGLYFAGNKDVGRFYRDHLGLYDPRIEAKIEELNRLRGEGFSPEMSKARENLGYEIMDLRDAARSAPARTYEVEIDHPESALLDMDSLVGDQTNIRQRLGGIGEEALRDRLTGYNVYELLKARHGGPPAASEVLLESGIPGMRYLDGNSRAAGYGTRNYVMFPGTEDSIRILRKYGLLAPMALPAIQEGE